MKNNFLKKLSVIATSIGLTLCMSSSILALPEARASRCTYCNIGFLHTVQISASPWYEESRHMCAHCPGGMDAVYGRTVTYKTYCTYCSDTYQFTRKETKLECLG